MRMIRCFTLVAALSLIASSVFAGASFQASPTPGVAVDGAVNFIYDPSDGSAVLTSPGVEGITTTTLESASSGFDPNAFGGTISPPFDQNTSSKLFKLTAPPAAISSLDFNAGYLPAGKDGDWLLNDVTWSGSIAPAGGWDAAPGGGPYASVVPEPSSIVLILCGVLGLFTLRRK